MTSFDFCLLLRLPSETASYFETPRLLSTFFFSCPVSLHCYIFKSFVEYDLNFSEVSGNSTICGKLEISDLFHICTLPPSSPGISLHVNLMFLSLKK